jgi:hypothetical protein
MKRKNNIHKLGAPIPATFILTGDAFSLKKYILQCIDGLGFRHRFVLGLLPTLEDKIPIKNNKAMKTYKRNEYKPDYSTSCQTDRVTAMENLASPAATNPAT